MKRNRARQITVPGLKPGMARADGNGAPSLVDVMAKIGELQATNAAFRAANDARLAALEKGKDDVVARETVDKVNAEVTKLSGELAAMQQKMEIAALHAGAKDKDSLTPEQREHKAAFERFVRRGETAGLSDLEVRAALTTDSKPDGGFLVTEELDRSIQRVLGITSAMRSIANVRPIGTDTLVRIKNLGGAASGWVKEKSARPETAGPKLAELKFEAHEMYANAYATQKMLDDSFVSIDGLMVDEVGISFAELEAPSFITGDGVDKPRGILSYAMAASTVSSPSAWGKIGYTVTGASGAFAAASGSVGPVDCLIDLRASLKPGYLPNARWLMNRDTEARIRKLKDLEGNYLWTPSITAGQPATLLGHPIAIDDAMPSFGANTFPIVFGDFNRGYQIVDRFGTRLLRDPYSMKPYVSFYATRRVGGDVNDFHALKALKAGTS